MASWRPDPMPTPRRLRDLPKLLRSLLPCSARVPAAQSTAPAGTDGNADRHPTAEPVAA